MDQNILNNIGYVIGWIMLIIVGGLYIINLYKLIIALRNKKYEIKTAIRAFGVITFVVGVLMGLVR